jgi:hypothetical protein
MSINKDKKGNLYAKHVYTQEIKQSQIWSSTIQHKQQSSGEQWFEQVLNGNHALNNLKRVFK